MQKIVPLSSGQPPAAPPSNNQQEPQVSLMPFRFGSSGYDISVNWLVKGYIPLESFGYMYGASGSYKSFCLIDIACCIATGKDWNGAKVKQGVVVYVAAEGGNGLSKRIKAWEIKNELQADKLAVVPETVIFDDENYQLSFVQTVLEIEKQAGSKVVAVCIDTLARCYSGNENDSKEMNKFIQSCDRVKVQTGAAMIAVHHSGKDLERGARGSSSLRAAADFELRVVRPKDTKLVFQVDTTKQKDSDQIDGQEFKLSPIDLGTVDEDGDPIMSLVVDGSAVQAAVSAYQDLVDMKNDSGKKPTQCQILMKIIRDQYGEGVQFSSGHVRDSFMSELGEGSDEAKRKGFQRAMGTLLRKEAIVRLGSTDCYMIQGGQTQQFSKPNLEDF